MFYVPWSEKCTNEHIVDEIQEGYQRLSCADILTMYIYKIREDKLEEGIHSRGRKLKLWCYEIKVVTDCALLYKKSWQ